MWVPVINIRAATQGRPYENQNTMHMIRHYHKGIRLKRRKFILQFMPPGIDHSACVIQNHIIV